MLLKRDPALFATLPAEGFLFSPSALDTRYSVHMSLFCQELETRLICFLPGHSGGFTDVANEDVNDTMNIRWLG
jgi:hypothetical protein